MKLLNKLCDFNKRNSITINSILLLCLLVVMCYFLKVGSTFFSDETEKPTALPLFCLGLTLILWLLIHKVIIKIIKEVKRKIFTTK